MRVGLITLRSALSVQGGVADDLVDAAPGDIERSERIDPFDVAEAAVFLSTLGKYAVVHQIVIDRLGAEW